MGKWTSSLSSANFNPSSRTTNQSSQVATPVRIWPADPVSTCTTYSHVASPITGWNEIAEMTSIHAYLESFACNLLQTGQDTSPSTQYVGTPALIKYRGRIPIFSTFLLLHYSPSSWKIYLLLKMYFLAEGGKMAEK